MKFIIPIIPKAQMRSRSRAFKPRGSDKIIAMNYKAPKQRSNEITIKSFLAQHQPKAPLKGALLLGLRVFIPIPAAKPKWFTGKPKEFQELARTGKVRPPSKPDMDNLAKQIKDCLTSCNFWKDDSQVVGYLPHFGKYYSDNPRWEVEIVPFNPEYYNDK